jgi:sulfite dehydrogenase (quinone) subunit SoeC
MHPAFSVIFLTTLIGVGQGLFLALFTVQAYALFGVLPPVNATTFYAHGSVLALAFIAAGLAASFFHLGRPERAWRSASQWRTSWLAREVIALPAFGTLLAAYGFAHLTGMKPTLALLPSGQPVDATVALGTIATLLAFALFVCTGMVYACLRFLREWHSPLTVLNYVLLGGASGFTLASAFAAVQQPRLVPFLAGWALALTLAAFLGHLSALERNRRLRPVSTLQSAIGIKHPVIAQKSRGFTGASFNTREFLHARPRAFLRAVKWSAIVGVFLVPALLLAAALSTASLALLAVAFAVQYLGLLAERWFFFAQANHPQNLYYQALA